MASKNKIKKLKNSYSVKSWLKNKTTKLIRGGFFTPSQRQRVKKFNIEEE